MSASSESDRALPSDSASLPQDGPASASDSSLEKLVEFLVAAKRSLSSTDHVWRANEIVTSARASLEKSVILGARTVYLRRGLETQVQFLCQIKDGVVHVARVGQTEFEAVLRDLDAADARVRSTLTQLTSTRVDPSFRPPHEERKSLHDFVDEEGVEVLKAGIRTSIDQTQTAQRELAGSIKAFGDQIKALKTALVPKANASPDHQDSDSPIPPMLRSMEEHAKEMADGLESLVRHYDLCVTAIKHTEDGGTATQNLSADLLEGLEISKTGEGASTEPISDTEKKDMLDVLVKDAADVEDVVMEIRDRLSDMESQSDYVIAHVDYLSQVYADTTAAFGLLEDVGRTLPEYLAHSHEFQARWEEEKSKIVEQLADLDAFTDTYDGFLRAYDGLVVEVGRRKDVQKKMEAVARDAVKKLDQLYQDDLAAREAFRRDEGRFLPSDIWSGLMDPPLRLQITPISQENSKAPYLEPK
ncbi:MAG: autophagy protein 17 [Caeruleum heppii]|nr:MAG: autophagy protein 17 [Caeruleum heppii]